MDSAKSTGTGLSSRIRSRLGLAAAASGIDMVRRRLFTKRRRSSKASVRRKGRTRLGKRRGPPGTRTRLKRRKIDDSSGSMVSSRVALKLGRYKRVTLRSLARDFRREQSLLVLAFRNLTPYTSSGGAEYLRNWSAIDNTTSREFPLHLFELTCCPNVQNGGSVDPYVGYKLQDSAVPGSGNSYCKFASIYSKRLSDAVDTNSWSREKTSQQSSSNQLYPYNNSVLKWVDIKLVCHGAATFPTKYDISLVQFTRPKLMPQLGARNETADIDKTYDEFYNYLVRPYAYNPLASEGATEYRKYIKVLHRVNFVLQPRDIDNDTIVTPFKEVKIFKKLDRFINYDWISKPNTGEVFPMQNTNTAPNFSASNSTSPYPTRRIFLMIRATSKLEESGTAAPPEPTDPNAVWPSYDYSIRTKHTFTA